MIMSSSVSQEWSNNYLSSKLRHVSTEHVATLVCLIIVYEIRIVRTQWPHQDCHCHILLSCHTSWLHDTRASISKTLDHCNNPVLKHAFNICLGSWYFAVEIKTNFHLLFSSRNHKITPAPPISLPSPNWNKTKEFIRKWATSYLLSIPSITLLQIHPHPVTAASQQILTREIFYISPGGSIR